ncbi:MAG: zinc ribbon domain-containing protein [Dermatophilaceae bacterium]
MTTSAGLCQHCGNALDSAHRFCGRCGAPVAGAASTTTPAPRIADPVAEPAERTVMRLGALEPMPAPGPTAPPPRSDDHPAVPHGNPFAGPGRGDAADDTRAAGPNLDNPPPLAPQPAASPAVPSISSDQLAIPREGVLRGLIAAGIGAVLVIVAWLLIGWWALVVALVAGAWATTVALTGDWVPDRDSVFIGVVAVPTVIRNLSRPIPAPHAGPVPTLAIAFLPLAGFFCGALGSAIHHSSESDVCKAYSAFESHQNSSSDSLGLDDSTWFSLLDDLGSTASDYGGSSDAAYIRSAGKAARKVAQGHGSGMFVTASVAEAESAIYPIARLCNSRGD